MHPLAARARVAVMEPSIAPALRVFGRQIPRLARRPEKLKYYYQFGKPWEISVLFCLLGCNPIAHRN
jgi:hypothetical protein